MILDFYRTLLVRHFSLSGHWCYAVACSCNVIFWAIDYFFVMRIMDQKSPYLDTFHAVKEPQNFRIS